MSAPSPSSLPSRRRLFSPEWTAQELLIGCAEDELADAAFMACCGYVDSAGIDPFGNLLKGIWSGAFFVGGSEGDEARSIQLGGGSLGGFGNGCLQTPCAPGVPGPAGSEHGVSPDASVVEGCRHGGSGACSFPMPPEIISACVLCIAASMLLVFSWFFCIALTTGAIWLASTPSNSLTI